MFVKYDRIQLLAWVVKPTVHSLHSRYDVMTDSVKRFLEVEQYHTTHITWVNFFYEVVWQVCLSGVILPDATTRGTTDADVQLVNYPRAELFLLMQLPEELQTQLTSHSHR